MGRAKTNQAREHYCLKQLDTLSRADVKAQAGPMGLALDASGEKAAARFLGGDYLIGNSGVTFADGSEAPFDAVSVLAHYLCSKGRGEVSPEFVPIGRLTGIASGTGASPSEQLFKPLADRFGADYAKFRDAALAMGATHTGLSQAGAQSFLFDSLPKLPVRAEFFEADDEFDAEIKIVFSSNATTFVMYEVLEITIICLVTGLLKAAGLVGEGDDLEASFI
jgi:hypothetical protein